MLKNIKQIKDKNYFKVFGKDAPVFMNPMEEGRFVFYLKSKDGYTPILESEKHDEECMKLYDSDPILNIMYTGSKYGTGDIILRNNGSDGLETVYIF